MVDGYQFRVYDLHRTTALAVGTGIGMAFASEAERGKMMEALGMGNGRPALEDLEARRARDRKLWRKINTAQIRKRTTITWDEVKKRGIL